jgi:hypothetical protein
MMIVDVSPTRFEYDAASDTATLSFSMTLPPSSMPPRTPQTRNVPAQLLLDGSGFLVGVDLGDAYEGRRVVALLGRHEDVASTKDSTVSLREERARDPDGLLSIKVPSARAAIRAHEKNPHA